MTRNAETPDTPVADGSRPAAEATPSAGLRTTQNGPVAELGLVAAGLGLVIYLIAFVAAAVYLVDVRPALRQVGGRGGGNSGPYGPW